MSGTPSAAHATAADFLFDNEELQALAGEALLRRAWRHAQDKRVVAVKLIDGEIQADVEDEESEEHLALTLGYDADGNLWYACDCGGADSDGGLCVHALAALLAFGTAEPPDAKLGDALAAAIAERVKRGAPRCRSSPSPATRRRPVVRHLARTLHRHRREPGAVELAGADPLAHGARQPLHLPRTSRPTSSAPASTSRRCCTASASARISS
jgi:hypothetical protein